MIGGNHGIFKSRLRGIEVDLLNDSIDETGFIDKHYYDGSYNGQYLYELTVCCKYGESYTLEIMVPSLLAEPYAGTVYRYIAPTTYTGPNGNVLRQYDCATITQIFEPSGDDPVSISNVAFELLPLQSKNMCEVCCSAEALFERRCDGAQIRLNISNSDFTIYTDPEKFYKYVGLVVLIDENGTPVYTNDFLRLISKSTTPSTSADTLNITSTEEWTCGEFDNDCGICQTYYKIVACDTNITEEYCTDQDLSAYLGSGVIKVTINNQPSDVCWIVEETAVCEFPVTISVSEEFTDCLECLTPLNYRLESCAVDDNTVIYTSTDLSQYIGRTVNLEGYGNCFFVEVFEENVPTTVQVRVTNDYISCAECPKPRYQLTNCEDPTDLIVTTVNLEAQIGSVIKISFYPEKCWTVSVTDDNTSDDPIILTDVFATCEECLPVLTCDCTIVKNTSSEAANFQYVDCDDVTNTVTLQAGQSTPKICAKEWIFPEGWTDTTCLQNFGECVDNVCPPPAIPFRKIKPGYNTPGCTIEYYERVTCKFADLMYNEVMSKRYGIEPCCPEDEFYKTHIKEQLLEMKAITDPQPCSTVPQVLYSCIDGICVEDINGTYSSIAECQSNCN